MAVADKESKGWELDPDTGRYKWVYRNGGSQWINLAGGAIKYGDVTVYETGHMEVVDVKVSNG